MILRVLFVINLLLVGRGGSAQEDNRLVVVPVKDGLSIVHKVWEGETVFTIAALYHVPPAILADANGLNYGEETMLTKTELLVPVSVYNQLTNKPAEPEHARPLYYQVRPEDDLYRISWRSNVSPNKLKHWNRLKDGKPPTGTYMLVGWVSYDSAQISPAARQHMNVSVRAPEVPDVPTPGQLSGPPPSSLEELYQKQIQDGENLISERGTAAFFRMPVKSGGMVYVFHSNAPKGTIIKIMNPGTGRVTYGKVLGPLPDTRQYHNAIIGISDKAKTQLGVRENKMWCELSYTGY